MNGELKHGIAGMVGGAIGVLIISVLLGFCIRSFLWAAGFSW